MQMLEVDGIVYIDHSMSVATEIPQGEAHR